MNDTVTSVCVCVMCAGGESCEMTMNYSDVKHSTSPTACETLGRGGGG